VERAEAEANEQLLTGRRGGYNLTGVGINTEMQLPSRPAPPDAVLLDQPFARTPELQAGGGRTVAPLSMMVGCDCTDGVGERRLSVVWSGTLSVRPSRLMFEPINPSAWR
jgi:hypothetical protein